MPVDPVSALDGEVKGLGCLAKDGSSAIGWEKVEVLINVVEGDIIGVGVDGRGEWWGCRRWDGGCSRERGSSRSSGSGFWAKGRGGIGRGLG